MKIDRIELEDVGDNPKRLAAALFEQIGITSGRVPIREIALGADIVDIKEEPLSGFEGALVTTPEKDLGVILVKSGTSEKRKRFTIGHELGHFLIGYHKPIEEKFQCTSQDMRTNRFGNTDRAAKMESDANRFSAELLMPRKLMETWLKRRQEADLAHIVDLSDDYCVSKEAAARRYIELLDEPLAVVFSHEGRVRYAIKHDDFPALDVDYKSAVPIKSETYTFSKSAGAVSEMDEVEQGFWLRNPKAGYLNEQVLVQRNGYRMTLLAVCESGDDDDEDEWEEPKFRR